MYTTLTAASSNCAWMDAWRVVWLLCLWRMDRKWSAYFPTADPPDTMPEAAGGRSKRGCYSERSRLMIPPPCSPTALVV